MMPHGVNSGTERVFLIQVFWGKPLSRHSLLWAAASGPWAYSLCPCSLGSIPLQLSKKPLWLPVVNLYGRSTLPLEKFPALEKKSVSWNFWFAYFLHQGIPKHLFRALRACLGPPACHGTDMCCLQYGSAWPFCLMSSPRPRRWLMILSFHLNDM